MHQAAHGVRGDQSEHPKEDENQSNSPKHVN
jgi:hypothetical protein